jgi:alkyl hydroperoxide reductase subunit AhpC
MLRQVEADLDIVLASLHIIQRLAYHAVRKSYIINQHLIIQAQVVRAPGPRSDDE